jgi:hypothetical protein
MAFFKGSFYENVPLFAATDEGVTVFRGLQPRKLDHPEAILEHSVALKERLDSVAHYYYAEGRAWRRIAETNPDVLFPEDLLFTPEPVAEHGSELIGNVILIPRRKEAAR